jgi:hypothetical protein
LNSIIFGGIVMLLRHSNNSCIKEKLIQQIRWEVKIQFATKGKFKKIKENDILYSACGVNEILV